MNELKSAEIAFLGNLPLSISNELKYALKAYHPTKKTVSTISYQKNNIIDNFTAIRKRKWITAKIKKMEWQKEERHEEKKLAIRKIFSKQGMPFIEVCIEQSNKTDVIPASICNSIKLLNETIPNNKLE